MIDWDRVAELREDIGTESFAEVIEIFLGEVGTVIAGLSPDKSAKTLAEELHFLKGSALNIGFGRLAELCAKGEGMAVSGQPDQVPLEQIRRCYAESRSVFLGSEMLAETAD